MFGLTLRCLNIKFILVKGLSVKVSLMILLILRDSKVKDKFTALPFIKLAITLFNHLPNTEAIQHSSSIIVFGVKAPHSTITISSRDSK